MLRSVARKLQKSINEEKDNPKAQLKPEHLRELSQVAINAQKIGKLALGQVQEISKVSADISNPEAFKEDLSNWMKLQKALITLQALCTMIG